MYHLKLVKGMSYTGIVKATINNPDVFTKNEDEYKAAINSGYFALVEHTEDTETAVVEEEFEPLKAETAVVEEITKPDKSVSRMSVEELKNYAESLGLVPPEGASKEELKSMVKEAERKNEEVKEILA